MKIVLIGTTLGLLLLGLVTGNWLTAQDSAALEQSERERVLSEIVAAQDSAGDAVGPIQAAWSLSHGGGFPGLARGNDNATSVALRAMKAAKDDAAMRQAEAELQTALEGDYDARLIGYERHLDRLADELTKMREQLQKRKSAKAEMVELRLQVLKAEASDLGWPNEVNSGVEGVWLNRSFGGESFGAPTGTTIASPPIAPASPIEPARASSPRDRAK